MAESQPDIQFNSTLACVFLNYNNNNANTKLICKFIITITPNIIFYFTIIIDFCLYFLNCTCPVKLRFYFLKNE